MSIIHTHSDDDDDPYRKESSRFEPRQAERAESREEIKRVQSTASEKRYGSVAKRKKETQRERERKRRDENPGHQKTKKKRKKRQRNE